jgi:hypothetical protein
MVIKHLPAAYSSISEVLTSKEFKEFKRVNKDTIIIKPAVSDEDPERRLSVLELFLETLKL